MPWARGTKACSTCRRLKVLCDYEKPQCLRCLRSGVVCEGYAKDAIFINRDPSNIHVPGRASHPRASNRTHAKQSANPKRSNTPSSPAGSTISKQPSNSEHSDVPSSPARPAVSRGSTPNDSDSEPLPIVEQTQQNLEIAVRDATATASLDNAWVLQATSLIRGPVLQLVKDYFATGGPVSMPAKLYAAIFESSGSSTLYDTAVSATALIRGGQVQGDERLVYQATSQYQKALKGLQLALRNPKTRQHDLTLAVCTAMCVYEMLAKSGKSMDPWMNHLRGMGQIICSRGPEACQSGIRHQIFLYYRQNAGGLAVMTRKSTFLSRREWLEIPFQKYPREIFHHFLDLMFRFASILEANDKTKLISPVDDRYRGHIATDCEDLRGAFVLWHEKFTNQSPNRQYYIEIPAFGLVTEDYRSARPVFASYLQFANLADPSAVMTYWAMYIYNSTTAQFNLRATNLVADTVCTNYAYLIARSVPFCLQDEFRTSGPLSMIYALRIAIQWFEHIGKEREVRWCEEVFARAVRGGNPFRDPEPEGDGEGGGEEWEVVEGNVFQLRLARYGADCLRLEFWEPPGKRLRRTVNDFDD